MPSASTGSIMAAAAKAAPQPINTNQPQSETQVYPFSQCQQVVTESNAPEDPESSDQVLRGRRPSWADMSLTEPDGNRTVVPPAVNNSQGNIPSSPPSFPLFEKPWLSSLKWELRDVTVRPMLTTAFEEIGFSDPSGTAAELLEESWKDILDIVKTKATLMAWVHQLRKKQMSTRACQPTPEVSDSRASTPVVPPLQLSPLVIQDTPNPHHPDFRHMPAVGTWCRPLRAARHQHHFIGSPRSPGPSKPNSFEDQYEALDQCNQVMPPMEDNEVFLTPEEVATGATDKQTKSVTFQSDVAAQTNRARPGERALPEREPRKRTRSPAHRPDRASAPRPLKGTTQFHLRAGMDFDATMGHPGEGPSCGDSSDPEMRKWFTFPGKTRTIIQASVRSPSTSPSEKTRRSGAWSSWPPTNASVVGSSEILRSPTAGSGEWESQPSNNENFASRSRAGPTSGVVAPAPNTWSSTDIEACYGGVDMWQSHSKP